MTAAAVVAVVAPALAGCVVGFGGDPPTATTSTDAPPDPGAPTTLTALEAGAELDWDLTAPVRAAAIGADDGMTVVPLDRSIDVAITLPTGVWHSTADELTIEVAAGRLTRLNLFATESGGEASEARLLADAPVLGLDEARIETWAEDELPAALAPERAGGQRDRTGFNGASGEVTTSVQVSLEPGPGGDDAIRFWYLLSPPG
ncbi:hypothetical protein FLP10_05455 [Agromyces intestinalis]|uniref:Uncharacterized protein n=1 Tax=Agromyces intestinalis TaxID=2592652 RepID=A0A5C1YD02_9MICO|nr:hypothetical protein [Agromyces intestinalis]QEO13931.1 hypothetical protein FLP10_05455 [Agromyces intestinalis]